MSSAAVQATSINRAYKDTVFRDLFGQEKMKANTLSLYNALNGTSYTDLDALELTTIDNAIFMGYKNDVSFLVGDELVLWEHQSTRNPNMALRGLMYFSELYSKFVNASGRNRFSTRQMDIPTPHYYVFYAGAQNLPDRSTVRLSDSFLSGPGDLEVTATVLNINEGHNSGIMEACEALAGYAHLIGLVRTFEATMDIARAVEAAVATCVDEGVLEGYLNERRSEVVSWLLTEWDEAEYLETLKQESREDGFAEGLAEGREEGRRIEKERQIAQIAQSVADGLVDLTLASSLTGFSVAEIEAALPHRA